MDQLPSPLAGYDDWPGFARTAVAHESADSRTSELSRVLGVWALDAADVVAGETWNEQGLEVTELSWSVGYGPRTRAWMLRPEGEVALLPGVLALHLHGHFKWLGAEQMLDHTRRRIPEARALQDLYFGGLAPAGELARRGYVVLAHDAFLWGSRRFPLETRAERLRTGMDTLEELWRFKVGLPSAAERYNAAAYIHEDTVAKAAGVLGTSIAGAVLADDLVALQVLSEQTGVDPQRLGCFGLSGGGNRSALLAALDPRIKARVVTGMMATFNSMMPLYLDQHSWLLNSPGLAQLGEWPEHAAAEARRPLLIQYGEADEPFRFRASVMHTRCCRLSIGIQAPTVDRSTTSGMHSTQPCRWRHGDSSTRSSASRHWKSPSPRAGVRRVRARVASSFRSCSRDRLHRQRPVSSEPSSTSRFHQRSVIERHGLPPRRAVYEAG